MIILSSNFKFKNDDDSTNGFRNEGYVYRDSIKLFHIKLQPLEAHSIFLIFLLRINCQTYKTYLEYLLETFLGEIA